MDDPARIANNDDLVLGGDAGASKIIGTQLEYSEKIFRWSSIVTNDPSPNEDRNGPAVPR